MTRVLRYAARSDRGLVRQSNQDAVYAGPRVLALADGMGGHAAGEVASKVVIAAFVPLDDDDPSANLLDQLGDATDTANAAIGELVDNDPELEGMGTTLTAILFAGNRLGLAHVGDSRAYLKRGEDLCQITHDDTFVQSLIEEGRITEQEAEHHPQRSLLLKALTGHEIEPTLTVREARDGDRYLLCSDGLSGVVDHETLAEALQIPDPQGCADRLIELALSGGGPDNVTCIVADVVDVEFGEHEPIIAGAAGDTIPAGPAGDTIPAGPAGDTIPAGAAGDNGPAGAAGDNGPAGEQPAVADDGSPTTAAAAPAEPASGSARRGRNPRRLIWGVVLLALLGGLGGTAYWWVASQYYVSATGGGGVVIYRGVQGAVLGMPLHSVAESSCPDEAAECETITLADLTPAVRNDVATGITVPGGLAGARATIDRLRSQQLLPPCPDGEQTPTQRSETFFPSPSTANQAGPPSSTGTAAAPTAQGSIGGAQPPTPDLGAQPGVDCREVR